MMGPAGNLLVYGRLTKLNDRNPLAVRKSNIAVSGPVAPAFIVSRLGKASKSCGV